MWGMFYHRWHDMLCDYGKPVWDGFLKAERLKRCNHTLDEIRANLYRKAEFSILSNIKT